MTPTLYKLTRPDFTGFGGYKYKMDEWHDITMTEYANIPERNLGTGGWFHCYESPQVAAFFNPIHARIKDPRMFEVEWKGRFKNEVGLRCGVTSFRIIAEIAMPTVTPLQYMQVAFRVATGLDPSPDLDMQQWIHDHPEKTRGTHYTDELLNWIRWSRTRSEERTVLHILATMKRAAKFSNLSIQEALDGM